MNVLDPLCFQRYAVFGLAKSGIAAANLLVRMGKSVVASDVRSSLTPEAEAALDKRIDVHLGGNVWNHAECVVVSPGLKPTLPLFSQLPKGLPVVPEVAIARAASPHRWLGITGTDGKTTTTELATHILRGVGLDAMSAGNIGLPLCDIVDQIDPKVVIVAELSAFQLWPVVESSNQYMALEAFALTNIAADHLDYFDGGMERYVAAKLGLVRKTVGEGGRSSIGELILNIDDEIFCREYASLTKNVKKLVTYGLSSGVSHKKSVVERPDLSLDKENGIMRLGDFLFDWRMAKLKGVHNAYNAMAAAGLVHALGIPFSEMVVSLGSFSPGPHRIEFIGEYDGVSWINDSKATNPHASQAGLESVEGGVVAIVGGVDKQLDLEDYARYLMQRLSGVVLIGEIKERLSAVLLEVGFGREKLFMAKTMEDAVEIGRRAAVEVQKESGGEVSVVLSPACSSFDMFQGYDDRGNQFCAAVKRIYS